jgi:hypothetical protein
MIFDVSLQNREMAKTSFRRSDAGLTRAGINESASMAVYDRAQHGHRSAAQAQDVELGESLRPGTMTISSDLRGHGSGADTLERLSNEDRELNAAALLHWIRFIEAWCFDSTGLSLGKSQT